MNKDIGKKVNKVKNFKQFVNENNENDVVRLSFLNIDDYNKSISILYKNGFKTPTSPDKGNGYYIIDDNWKTIDFNINLKDDILHLLGDIKYEIDFKKPLDYKIFNQGGYLD